MFITLRFAAIRQRFYLCRSFLLYSVINGDEMYNEYVGEYAYENGVHNIAYGDYTGTDLTKNGIQATDTAMLLHRAGAFEGDMFFDLNSDTVVNYNALMVNSGFLLHTENYSLSEKNGEIIIKVAYTLHDGSNQDVIKGRQEITVKQEDSDE